MSTDRIENLLAQGEDKGCLNLTQVHDLLESLELEDEEIETVYHRIDERGIELSDDCGRTTADDPTYVNGDLAVATTDALQLFLNEAGRYPLLTAAEEVELSKRIERGE